MKKLYFSMFLLAIAMTGYAQTANPGTGITYQAVIIKPHGQELPGQNNNNAPLANIPVCLRFSIIDDQSQIEYQETAQVVTDKFGMVNLMIGLGNPVGGYAGNFGGINWGKPGKKLRVELDDKGNCSSFVFISEAPFGAVPYALNSNATALGLGNVDNTSDMDKPVSTAQQAALNLKEDVINKSTATTLGTSDILYPTQNAVKTYVDNQVAASTPDASTTTKGKIQLAGDLSGTAEAPTVPGLLLKEPTIAAGNATQYYRGDKTWQTLDKTAVGLGNIDNTSDIDKPVSTAQQVALNLKEDVINKSTATTLGTSDILYPTQNAVKTYVDSQDALKAPLASPGLTGTPTAPTATLGDNTTQIATTAFVANALVANNNAIIEDAITDGEITKAPTENAVHDALLLKANQLTLDQEITDRTNADTALGNQINQTSNDLAQEIVDRTNADALKAPLLSPALTGVPTAPTAASTDNSTQIATTEFVTNALTVNNSNIIENAINDGVTTKAPTEDAVYDALALKAPLESPGLTGIPTAPTAAPGTSTTQIATTAFVTNADTNFANKNLTSTGARTHTFNHNLVIAGSADKSFQKINTTTGDLTAVGVQTGQAFMLTAGQAGTRYGFVSPRTDGNVELISRYITGSDVNELLVNIAYDGMNLKTTNGGLIRFGLNNNYGAAGQVLRSGGTGNMSWLTLDKSAVGLGNVDNTSDMSKPVSTAMQTALNLKAPLESPALTGAPTAPTPGATDNSTKIATTAFVANAISSASHNPVTLGTANGLSLSTQVLSLGLASGSANGALSSTDWNTFNAKQNLLSGTGIVKSTAGTISYLTDNSSNWNTAYSERNQWDGGAIGLNASTGRTSLGASTIGSNLFTSANPSAITFLRANADNSVSWLDAATFRTAIGAGTSTVTPAALTKIDDTNVTLSLGGTPATALLQDVSLTLGWVGTLADSRIASADTWNAKQSQLNGNGFVKATGTTISYDNTAYEPAFSKNTAFNKNFGTASGTVAEGNDSRINNGQTAFGWGNHAGLYPLLSSSYADPSWISSLAWTKITGTPTTLGGYGITDAAPINSPIFTGTPEAPTPTTLTGIANKDYVDSAITDAATPDATTAEKGKIKLAGDLSGTADLPTVNLVGGVTAANVASGANLANAATDANTLNTIVKRDASGNFNAGIITAKAPTQSPLDNSTNIATTAYVDSAVATNVVHITGTETITGAKTFSANVGINTSAAATEKLEVNGIVKANNYISPVQPLVTANTLIFDTNNYGSAQWTLGTSTNTLSIPNVKAGMYGSIIVTNSSTTNTIGFAPGTTNRVINGGGGTLTLTQQVGAVDILTFFYDGSIFWWTVGNNYN